jgi:hypothetical protein
MDRDLPPAPLRAMSRRTRAKTSMEIFISANPSQPILYILQSLAEPLEIRLYPGNRAIVCAALLIS